MPAIRSVFDPSRPIDRRIEKVIQYDARSEELLRQEITEYVVTNSIEGSFMKLLDRIDEGMGGSAEHEVGIWVSGFYGSGKSSFTKYLGMALDPSRKLQARPFRDWLADQFRSQPLKARLATVATKNPMTVLLLDLSTETLVGPTLQAVSTVLYHKVLEWAGYSRERKIAYFEQMIDKDKRRAEFEKLVSKDAEGESWAEMRNDPMTALTHARKVASKMYPNKWPKPEDFDAVNPDTVESEDERVEKMLRIIREKSGNPNVLFVVDEVGQYVAPDDDRITNLQGLAQNLKRLGRGKAWIVATAQQTLTEDDARAAFNTPKLFKLKDRFPISVDLEASDIREICHTRLLGKSAEGKKKLEELYAAKGERLRHLTKLKDARGYSVDLDKGSFVDLYPFLPQHFDILLKILGRLARTTGGVGLRSAIKVVQDILVEKAEKKQALADAPLGTLATAVWFYDSLRQDIERSVRHASDGVSRTREAFRGSAIHENVAKAVAVMQVLEDFPLTAENLVALMLESVDAEPRAEDIRKALDDLLKTESVPLTEVDGRLRFMSDRVRDLARQRSQNLPMQSDRRVIIVKALEELFHPQPTVNVYGTRRVSAGLKLMFAGHPVQVYGEREEVQVLLDLVRDSNFGGARQAVVAQSREPGSARTVFAVGTEEAAFDETVTEIFRSERIAIEARSAAPDKEIDDYVTGQRQRAQRLRGELQGLLRQGLLKGAFIFRGKETAVRTLDPDLMEAARRQLSEAGDQVYDKYPHAAAPADSTVAEKLLKTRDLAQVSGAADPLGLCSGASRGRPVNTAHPALVDIHDYLDRIGPADGQKLLEDFGRSPYGWSKDTIRYLVAALLIAGEITLRANNQDLLTRSEAAIEAIRNVPKFNKAGIRLRTEPVDQAAVLRAAKRLSSITGEEVLPLEENVNSAVQRNFPGLQARVAPLVVQLQSLGLSGVDRAVRLQKTIQDLLSTEANVVKRLGATDSEANEDIVWAGELLQAFENGLADPVRQVQRLGKEIAGLPHTGIPEQLRQKVAPILADLQATLSRDDFYRYAPEIRQKLVETDQAVASAVAALRDEQASRLAAGRRALKALPEWARIGDEPRQRLSDMVTEDASWAQEGLDGIAETMARRFSDTERLEQARVEVLRLAKEAEQASASAVVHLRLPRIIRSPEQLEAASRQMSEAKKPLTDGAIVELELE